MVIAVVLILVILPDDTPAPPVLVSNIAGLEPVAEEPDSTTFLAILPGAPLVLESGNGIIAINLEAGTVDGAAEVIYRPVSLEELEELPEIPVVYTAIARGWRCHPSEAPDDHHQLQRQRPYSGPGRPPQSCDHPFPQ